MIEAKKNLKENLSEDNSPFEGGQGDVKTSFDPKNKIIPYNPKLKEFSFVNSEKIVRLQKFFYGKK